MPSWEAQVDLLVIDTGIAGLITELQASELGLRVLAVSKSNLSKGNTRWTQGGITIALADSNDDTLGLYAVGEVARTGFHGANRLASNSLLESVCAKQTAIVVVNDICSGRIRISRYLAEVQLRQAPIVSRKEIQRVMSSCCGIGRSAEKLASSVAYINQNQENILLDSRKTVEDAALTLTANLVLRAAITRTESRGCHMRTDYPHIDDLQWRRGYFLQA